MPDREPTMEGKIARVDQKLEDLKEAVVAKEARDKTALDDIRREVKGLRAYLIGFAFTVAASCIGLVITLISTGR